LENGFIELLTLRNLRETDLVSRLVFVDIRFRKKSGLWLRLKLRRRWSGDLRLRREGLLLLSSLCDDRRRRKLLLIRAPLVGSESKSET